MTETSIPEDVKQFMLQHIDSIAQWEALLLLRTDPSVYWHAETVARRLYISLEEAESILNTLATQGFLRTAPGSSPVTYHYEPKSSELEPMVARLVTLYARYLVPMTQLIHAKSKSKVQKFADAFWLRKDKE